MDKGHLLAESDGVPLIHRPICLEKRTYSHKPSTCVRACFVTYSTGREHIGESPEVNRCNFEKIQFASSVQGETSRRVPHRLPSRVDLKMSAHPMTPVSFAMPGKPTHKPDSDDHRQPTCEDLLQRGWVTSLLPRSLRHRCYYDCYRTGESAFPRSALC